MISIIAAVAKNGVIGKNNLMPWHIPEEMQLFRQLTLGKPLIIGRRTYESLPNMLEGRQLIILSRNLDFATGSDAARVARSIPEALATAKQFGEEILIGGGENIYQQFMNKADRLLISHIKKEYEGDAFFPGVRYSEWTPIASENHEEFSFVTYQRAHATSHAARKN